ncbi:uncharacterized protein RCC_01116 [Ramularia collo-cygni]|uniref:Uncharacterized protein n=1 Tax=Ramularia collo-cygni TaxID=112498 RepID=A0A2D3URV2_9PEZI|nr:uncharacterized protein RCC_01116 [Ramularia collo-cygni]CZT15250.1 uncharacterized protein RCC_01116 [Ramularia collo-cygni]
MQFIKCLGISTVLYSLASATSCTSDLAIPWTFGSGSDDSASAAGAELRAEGEANALGLIGKRESGDLDCTFAEICLVDTDNMLFCMDANTGDFHDISGGTGNVYTGETTTQAGEDETTADDETPSSTASGPGSISTAKSGNAGACTSDVAIPVPLGMGASGSQANCAAVEAVGTSSCDSKRASSELECTSGEMCILYGATLLMCYKSATGDYRDEHGGKGNEYSGKYTASNGEVQTVTGTMLPALPTAGASKDAGEATSTSTTTSVGGSGNSDSSAPQKSAVASQQSTGATVKGGTCGVLLAVAMSVLVAAVRLTAGW